MIVFFIFIFYIISFILLMYDHYNTLIFFDGTNFWINNWYLIQTYNISNFMFCKFDLGNLVRIFWKLNEFIKSKCLFDFKVHVEIM